MRRRGVTPATGTQVIAAVDDRKPSEGTATIDPASPPSPPPQAKRPRGRPTTLTPNKVQQAIGMRAAGMPTGKIAQAMDVTRGAVQNAISRIPDAQEQIDVYRQNLRLKTIKHIYDKHEMLWQRIGEEIPAGAAKDVDALFRAAHASEKMAAAVTGESVKVEVTGEAPQVEIKNLLMQLGLDGLKELG